MSHEGRCRCCGDLFHVYGAGDGDVDATRCPDCADNAVYGAECGHDPLPRRSPWVRRAEAGRLPPKVYR